MRSTLTLVLMLLASCADSSQANNTSSPTVAVDQQVAADYSQFSKRCRPYLHHFKDSENPSRFSAQMEQESGCNPFAESPFAKGLMQFTDKTGEWLSVTHCKHLGPYDPFNEKWSADCSQVLMRLNQSDNDYGNYCFNKKVAEGEYNGGAWMVWELRKVNNASLSAAQEVCGTVRLHNGRKRAGWACRENYKYPKYISKHQLKYKPLGGIMCD